MTKTAITTKAQALVATLHRSLLNTIIVAVTLLCCLPAGVVAQEKFTDHLTRQKEGEGAVSVKHDAEIERLVNGSARPAAPTRGPQRNTAATATAASPATAATAAATARDTTAQHDSIGTYYGTRRALVNGFRIQVYAGANNRKSKSEAYQAAGLVHTYFDYLTVYTHFVSPRWVCRVGDFRTSEEAREVLEQMRQTGRFPEATIVKTKVIVYI